MNRTTGKLMSCRRTSQAYVSALENFWPDGQWVMTTARMQIPRTACQYSDLFCLIMPIFLSFRSLSYIR